MIKPKKGYKFIKLDLTTPKGDYIGQYWYETSIAFKPNWNEVRKGLFKVFPLLKGKSIIVEPVKNEIQPIEKIRICHA